MQRIERYGVIALVFLLVTILAVAVWGQRKNQSLLSFLKRDKSGDVAKLDTPLPGVSATNTGLGLSMPTHEVSAALEQQAPVAGAIDPALRLATPAGPGLAAVNFEQGSALPQGAPPNGGFIGVGGAAVAAGAAPASDPLLVPLDAGPRTYKVKNGDTLGLIAQRELGSTKRWKEIEALNGVKAERLSVGMVLKLPAGAPSTGAQTLVKLDNAPRSVAAPGNSASGDAPSYRVRSGDSLSKIAAAQLGDANRYAEILLLNPGVNPAKLSIGLNLRMPANAKAQSAAAKPKPRPSQATAQLARADTAPKKAKVQ